MEASSCRQALRQLLFKGAFSPNEPPTVSVWVEDDEAAPVSAEPTSALLDTGADYGVIDEKVAERLQLRPVGWVQVNTPTDSQMKFQYVVTLVFRDRGKQKLFKSRRVIGTDLSRQKLGVIIGRDILRSGRLVVAYQPLTQEVGFRFTL